MVALAHMGRCLGDLLLSRTCLVCGRQLGSREEHLCIYCAADIPFTYDWLRVHNPTADRFNATVTLRHPDTFSPYVQAAALMYYSGDYQAIPKALKYQANLPAGQFFARMLGERLAASPAWADVDLVVPVPLHWTRRWQRGYNQAEVIARELAACLGARCAPDMLRRPGRTRTQTRLDAEDRLRNVSSAFQLRRALPARHLLLVDDTLTTGATLCACRDVLLASPTPPAKLSVATLAAVP